MGGGEAVAMASGCRACAAAAASARSRRCSAAFASWNFPRRSFSFASAAAQASSAGLNPALMRATVAFAGAKPFFAEGGRKVFLPHDVAQLFGRFGGIGVALDGDALERVQVRDCLARGLRMRRADRAAMVTCGAGWVGCFARAFVMGIFHQVRPASHVTRARDAGR